MDTGNQSGAATFKEQELAGWQAKAHAYDDYAGRVTTQAVEPLLDAARVLAGARLLDVACGPGYAAGGAIARGAKPVGVDFAATMVDEARRKFPLAEFRCADAEALPFEANSFDAVVSAFGIGHLPDPDKGIAECFRVLRRGGTFAFAWWCSPEKHELFALVLEALKTHGNMNVPLPPAPPMFRFSDPAECVRALEAAGFVDAAVREHRLVHEPESAQEVLDLIYKSSVRTAMVLEQQTRRDRQRIDEAILIRAHAYERDGRLRLAWPALVASGRKP